MVRIVHSNSSPLIVNTSTPQSCGLSALLYSLYTYNTHSSNAIIKFTDDTTVVGLITDNDETAYREEVHSLTLWCQQCNLSLNINKIKEILVDFRRQDRQYSHIGINGKSVYGVSRFKLLGVHITEDLIWSAHTVAVVKKAHQCLLFLRWLRMFGLKPPQSSHCSTPAPWRAS